MTKESQNIHSFDDFSLNEELKVSDIENDEDGLENS